VSVVYYAFSNDEAPYGFSNAHIYGALRLPLPTSLPLAQLDVGIKPDSYTVHSCKKAERGGRSKDREISPGKECAFPIHKPR
jgi:hypothetical protein